MRRRPSRFYETEKVAKDVEGGSIGKSICFHVDVLTVSISTLSASTIVLGDDRYKRIVALGFAGSEAVKR